MRIRSITIFGILIALGSQLLGAPGQPLSEPEAQKVHPDLREISSGEIRSVWVFFSDKGIQSAARNGQVSVEPGDLVSQRSLRRRSKVRPEGRLVDSRDLPVAKEYVDAITRLATRRRTISKWFNAVSVEATNQQIERIAALPFVKQIKPVARGRRNPKTGNADIPKGWKPGIKITAFDYGPSSTQADMINVPKVHDLGLTGDDVLICALDTGFRLDEHEALTHIDVINEWDFVDNDSNTDGADDVVSHGTVVVSICAGFAEGKLIGPAFEADFLLARTEDTSDEYPLEEDFWQAGVEWADSIGADIISSSVAYIEWYDYEDLDGNTAVTTIAADWAAANGILVCNSIGNYGPSSGSLAAPADADSIVAVGTVDPSGTIAPGSARGPTYDGRIKPEVVALGTGAYGAEIGAQDGYEFVYGTSYSAPQVSGVAALILENHPEWGPMQTREALMQTGSHAESPNNDYGYGIIDAYQAVFYKSIGGRIVDLISEEPLSNAMVTYTGAGSGAVYTGSDGRFLISDLAEGAYTLTASAADYNEKIGVYEVAPWIGDADFALIPEGIEIPAIHMLEVAVDDDDQGASAGDGDSEVDVNETIELNVLFFNDGNLAAENSVVEAKTSSPFVEMLTSQTNAGAIDPGETLLVECAVVFTVLPTAPHGEEVTLSLRFTANDDYETNDEFSLTLTANMPWWPRSYDIMVSAPKLLDLDGDNDLEILFGDASGNFHILHHDGTPFDGWPVSLGEGISLIAPPILADIDLDREYEIIASSTVGIQCWNIDGSSVPGWPSDFGLSPNTVRLLCTMVADLDNDGDQEIVAATVHGDVYVWTHTGELANTLAAADTIYSSPAIGDLDGDGDFEIVVGSCPPADGTIGYIHAWHHDGTEMSGEWPVVTSGMLLGGISVADLDGDGADEIVVPSSNMIGTPYCELHVLRGDGTYYPGWPQTLGSTIVCQPAIGDLDLDGNVEIVIPVNDTHGSSLVHALTAQGFPLDGWPVALSSRASFISPTIGDLDADGYPDILVATEGGEVHALAHTGMPLQGFPYVVDDVFAHTGEALINDLDADGDVELVIATLGGDVYAWDLAGDYDSVSIPWGMTHHDYRNTSNYGMAIFDSLFVADPTVALPIDFHLYRNYPNPFSLHTTLRFAVPVPSIVSLDVFDLTGRVIRKLIDQRSLKAGSHELRWNGLNDDGGTVSSGMYFYRIRANLFRDVKHMIMIR